MQIIEQDRFQKLRNLPRTMCAKCNTPISYGNPMARCFECKLKFCFDHVWGGQINAKMQDNEEIRDICDSCKKVYAYSQISL